MTTGPYSETLRQGARLLALLDRRVFGIRIVAALAAARIAAGQRAICAIHLQCSRPCTVKPRTQSICACYACLYEICQARLRSEFNHTLFGRDRLESALPMTGTLEASAAGLAGCTLSRSPFVCTPFVPLAWPLAEPFCGVPPLERPSLSDESSPAAVLLASSDCRLAWCTFQVGFVALSNATSCGGSS